MAPRAELRSRRFVAAVEEERDGLGWSVRVYERAGDGALVHEETGKERRRIALRAARAILRRLEREADEEGGR